MRGFHCEYLKKLKFYCFAKTDKFQLGYLAYEDRYITELE